MRVEVIAYTLLDRISDTINNNFVNSFINYLSNINKFILYTYSI